MRQGFLQISSCFFFRNSFRYLSRASFIDSSRNFSNIFSKVHSAILSTNCSRDSLRGSFQNSFPGFLINFSQKFSGILSGVPLKIYWDSPFFFRDSFRSFICDSFINSSRLFFEKKKKEYHSIPFGIPAQILLIISPGIVSEIRHGISSETCGIPLWIYAGTFFYLFLPALLPKFFHGSFLRLHQVFFHNSSWLCPGIPSGISFRLLLGI